MAAGAVVVAVDDGVRSVADASPLADRDGAVAVAATVEVLATAAVASATVFSPPASVLDQEELIHENLYLELHHSYLTICPRSSDQFYIVSYFLKWVTTSWTDSIYLQLC